MGAGSQSRCNRLLPDLGFATGGHETSRTSDQFTLSLSRSSGMPVTDDTSAQRAAGTRPALSQCSMC